MIKDYILMEGSLGYIGMIYWLFSFNNSAWIENEYNEYCGLMGVVE